MLRKRTEDVFCRFAGSLSILLGLFCSIGVASEGEDSARIAELKKLQIEVRALRDEVLRLSGRLERGPASKSDDDELAEKGDLGRLVLKSTSEVPPSRTTAALQKRLSIRVNNLPLGDVVRETCRLIGVKYMSERDALAREGVSTDDLVSFDVSDVSAHEILNSILKPRNLTYRVDDGILRIAPGSSRNDSVLMADHSNTTEARPTAREWKTDVAADTPERTEPQNLDAANTSGFRRSVSESSVATQAEITKSLQKRVSLKYIDAPLIEVIVAIKESMNANVVIDEGGLVEEGVSTSQRVSVDIHEVSAQSALNLILKPLNLTYILDDDVLKITNQVRAKGPLSTVTYPLGKLICRLTEAELKREGSASSNKDQREKTTVGIRELITLITTTIAPESWEAVGGQGSLGFSDSMLVVRQTADVHQEITGLLKQLNRSKRLDARGVRPAANECINCSYAVADLVLPVGPAKEGTQSPVPVATADWLRLVDRITNEIEPENWSSNGGPAMVQVYEQRYSLIIRATPEMHESIAELLGAMRNERIQVCLRVKTLAVFSDAELEQAGLKFKFGSRSRVTPITGVEAERLARLLTQDRNKLLHHFTVTTFNGQTATVGLRSGGQWELAGEDAKFTRGDGSPPDLPIHLRGNVAADRRSVCLGVAINSTHPVNDLINSSCRIEDGGYLLVDLREIPAAQQNPAPVSNGTSATQPSQELKSALATNDSTIGGLMLIQPQIIVLEEVEERLDSAGQEPGRK